MTEPTATATISDADATDTAEGLGPVPQIIFAFGDRGRRTPEVKPLFRGQLEIGRGAAPMDIAPLDDKRISRQHARFTRGPTGWSVADLGSRNGTAVNGVRLTAEHTLSDGDVIRTGDTLMVFRMAPVRPRVELTEDPQHPLRGISAAIEGLRADIAAVAPREISILVRGETGCGKEVVARTVHAASGRSGRFVALNCAAMPAELLESTLFGHTRGAFTGADRARKGLIRDADGGTLFLDELGEMPAPLQAKLLRVLESSEVRPVGGSTVHPVDVRVISATHRDLAAAVRDGAFRLDLYGRLAHWTINLAPLRSRPEDVPALAARFSHRPMEAGLIEALMLHPWPLNVRGLRAIIARCEIESEDALRLSSRIREALDESRRFVAGPSVAPVVSAPTEASSTEASSTEASSTEASPTEDRAAKPSRAASTPMPVREVPTRSGPREPPDRQTVVEGLTRERGRVAAVARSLGASRQQVYRWLALYDLRIEDFRGG